MTAPEKMCPDGKYRGCDFMGCDDRMAQRSEGKSPWVPCRKKPATEDQASPGEPD